MTEEDSISKIMLKQHYEIDKCIHRFDTALKQDDLDLRGPFNKLKWEIEKHFFIEEKAIFQLHYSENKETSNITIRLKKEHDILIDAMEQIEDRIKNNEKIDLPGFREQILNHAGFENKHFYPRLDDELDEERKRSIIERLTNCEL